MRPFTAPVDDILSSLNPVVRAVDLPDWDTELAEDGWQGLTAPEECGGMAPTAPVEPERRERPEPVDFLTPQCKVSCRQAGMRAADLGTQSLEGCGHLGDYRIAQTWRDEWSRTRCLVLGQQGLTLLAHEFANMASEPFFRAIWSRFVALGQDDDPRKPRDRALSRPFGIQTNVR